MTITEGHFGHLDAKHVSTGVVLADGSPHCKGCGSVYPCETRLVIDLTKDAFGLCNTLSTLHMVGIGLIAELGERLSSLEDEYVGSNEARRSEETTELLRRAQEYLEAATPQTGPEEL